MSSVGSKTASVDMPIAEIRPQCNLNAVAGLIFQAHTLQAVIYPMELVRTRLAVSSQGQYKGMADCIRNVLKYEGVRAFYRGLTPSLVNL